VAPAATLTVFRNTSGVLLLTLSAHCGWLLVPKTADGTQGECRGVQPKASWVEAHARTSRAHASCKQGRTSNTST
jgi:hypothetical protein